MPPFDGQLTGTDNRMARSNSTDRIKSASPDARSESGLYRVLMYIDGVPILEQQDVDFNTLETTISRAKQQHAARR